uniref:Putative secreted protein n=1 Tax=Anopheles marajoara TaxID=58244 RepID=A0A2M4C9H3_9DIPT
MCRFKKRPVLPMLCYCAASLHSVHPRAPQRSCCSRLPGRAQCEILHHRPFQWPLRHYQILLMPPRMPDCRPCFPWPPPALPLAWLPRCASLAHCGACR